MRGQSRTYAQIMQLGVLGPAQASSDGAVVDLGPRKQRALLAALALHHGRAVSVDTIVDLLWPEDPPPGVGGTLQTYVAGLRRALEPDRPARSEPSLLLTVGGGYLLAVPDDDLDVVRFHSTLAAAHEAIAPLQVLGEGRTGPGEHLESMLDSIDEALRWWRGTPFLELMDAPAASAERNRLERLQLMAHEDRAVIGLALGRHTAVAADLDLLTARHPLHERLWALQAVALARSGRQAAALETLDRVRTTLAEDLGIDPGAELRAVQAAVLGQHPSVDPHPVRTGRPPPRTTHRSTPWPLVGREGPLRALTALLGLAAEGQPCFATVVGEAGIGKTRLVDEFATLARESGADILFGRCSQDEGAPPLWPWRDVLDALGVELPAESGEGDAGARFRMWDQIVRTILARAAQHRLVVVIDDLHWADASSLRVLRLLVEIAQSGHLIVIATWRDNPAPASVLGSVAESFARRHATRVELGGLTAEEAGQIVGSVTDRAPSADDARDLRSRTDGNPFFLVEYARLAAEQGNLRALLSEVNPPGAVGDVLGRRLAGLAESTVEVLRAASVIGRAFDTPGLAAVATAPQDVLQDALSEATAAGLLRDEGVHHFHFTHALVRDAVYTSIPATRRADMHAHMAAHLEPSTGRESEVARHWLAAGPQNAAKGWRAALSAAAAANTVYAYEEAVEMARAAHDALLSDTEATARNHHEVLLLLAEALRRTGDWTEARTMVHRAIAMGEDSGDVKLIAQAAVSPSADALWQAVAHGTVDPIVVAALRQALDQLDPDDGELRCRVMLALAFEIYYGASTQECEALATEGIAMARRVDDPELLLTAFRMAFVALGRAATAEFRLTLIDEALEMAENLRDDRALTIALTLRASLAYEIGDVEMGAAVAMQARHLAEAQRHFYAQMVLDTLEIPWLAMAGRHQAAGEMVDHLSSLGERLTLAQYEDALGGARLFAHLWRGSTDQYLPAIAVMAERSALPLSPVAAMFMIRAGRLSEARAYLTDHPIDLSGDTWLSLFIWGASAEVAVTLGDADLGATTYTLLKPFAGRTCCANSAVAMGPVDAFLALAAAASGASEVAADHADDALELCRKWEIPLVAAWLQDHRDTHHF